jgi:hypothetical protein
LLGSDGSRYKGAFRDWRFNGNGSLQLADGSQYIGGFASDAYQAMAA